MAQTPPPAPNLTPGSPDRRALLQAFQDVVRSEQEKRSHPVAPEPSGARRTTRTVLLLAAAGLLVILVAQPRWLFPRPPEETPALSEASLRVRMFVEIDRVERFRADSGRLPRTLVEAGADTSGLTYTPVEGGYTLSGVNQGLSLTYRSGTPPREFLGDSYRLITQRGKS
jgi:hypothetical protein